MQNAILSLLSTTPNATKGVRVDPVSTGNTDEGFALIAQAGADQPTQTGTFLVAGLPQLPQLDFPGGLALEGTPALTMDLALIVESEGMTNASEITPEFATDMADQGGMLNQGTAPLLTPDIPEEAVMRLSAFGTQTVTKPGVMTSPNQAVISPVFVETSGVVANAPAANLTTQFPEGQADRSQSQLGPANLPQQITAVPVVLAKPVQLGGNTEHVQAQTASGRMANRRAQGGVQTALPTQENAQTMVAPDPGAPKPKQELGQIPVDRSNRQAAAPSQMNLPTANVEIAEVSEKPQLKQEVAPIEVVQERLTTKETRASASETKKLATAQMQVIADKPQNLRNAPNGGRPLGTETAEFSPVIPTEYKVQSTTIEKSEAPVPGAHPQMEASFGDRISGETSSPNKLEMSPQTRLDRSGAVPAPLSLSGIETGQISGLANPSQTTDSFSLNTLTARQEPALARHVAAQVVEIAQPLPNRPVDMTLSPEELGKVRLTFTTENGALAVSITAERPETLDLMRRHIETLAQELRTIGYRDISFGFGQSGENTGSQTPDEFGNASSDVPHEEAADLAQEGQALAQALSNRDPATGIDIRI